jgi:hypothetical protein
MTAAIVAAWFLAEGAAPGPAGTDEIVIIDAVAPAEVSTVTVGEEPPSESMVDPVFAAVTRYRLALDSRLLVDTAFEKGGEDVVEWWSTAKLRLEHRPSQIWRFVADVWGRWGVAGRDPRPDHRFLLVNARDPRWTGEAELREGYASFAAGRLEVRVGEQLFVWGKNEVFAGADVLNPLDLRYDPLRVLETPKDALVPVFAVDAGVFDEDWSAEVVVLPFFTKNRGFLVGRDFAVAPPGSDLERRILTIGQLHPSAGEELQQAVQGTEEPTAAPIDFSWAARGTAKLAGWDFAGTAYYGWDRTPRVRIDPDLAVLLESADRILADPQLLAIEPRLRNASLGVQQKTLAGEELVRSRFRRFWRLALEAQGVVGDVVTRADVGFSPAATFYTSDFVPISRPSVTAALGAEYTYGESWYVALTGYSLVVPQVPAWGRLLSLEAASVEPRAREAAALYGLVGHLRWRWDEEGVTASVIGSWNIAPGDRLLWVEAQYDHLEPHSFKVGAMVMGGPAGTLAWAYAENNLVYVAYAAAW